MLTHKDYSTFNFLQWYVSEQHEEEALFRGIVDKIKLIGEHGNGLYLADQYIKNIALSRKIIFALLWANLALIEGMTYFSLEFSILMIAFLLFIDF